MESYPLSYSSWGSEEISALHRVIASGQFTLGPEVKRFEEKFAEKFHHKYAVMVNSGSSANLLAMAALRYRKEPLEVGAEVIVPALAWSTTYAPLHQLGLKIKIIDIDLPSLNMSAEALNQAISPESKMVLAVSILGNPAPLKKFQKICQDKNLLLMEDNCESLGTSVDGKFTGTFGLLSTCSFFYAHHISTMEGGIVATDDREIYELLLCLRAHGWTRNLPHDSVLVSQRQDDFNEAYRFLLPGYNFRPLEFCGAVGLEQLKKIDQMNEIRRANYSYFLDLFAEDKRFYLQKENERSAPYCFTMVVKEEVGFDRQSALNRLRENSIEFRMITGGNIMQHEYAKKLNISVHGELKNAELVHNNGFFVGNGPIDLRKNIDHLFRALKDL